MNNPPPQPTQPQRQPEIVVPQNYHPDQEMLRLRRRIGDLLRLGAATPETFQQAVMQLWQEGERRRQACLQEAEEYQRKYQACLSQAGAFAAQSSILYAIVNGFATLEERRLQEMSVRAAEKAQAEADQKAEDAKKSPVAKTNGQPAQEAAGEPTGKSSGGKRKKA